MPRIFNISTDSVSLNIPLSLQPYLSQIIERNDVLSKIYDIPGFLNFLILLHWMH